MSPHLHLGSLRLSCPSTGLDLALTSNASISTLAQCSSDSPSITNIESGRIWLAPNTNVRLLLAITWPISTSSQHSDALRKCLLTALQHAAVSKKSRFLLRLWSQLDLQPSLTVEPSQYPNTCLFIISLTSAPSLIPKKKLPIHRLGNNVHISHVKPPDGLPHWTLDQVYLRLDIRSLSQSSTSHADCMLFESSTLPEDRVNMISGSSDESHSPEHILGLIDVALRLALTDLPPRALSGIKVTERSSFRHLDEMCPAMWSPGHIEALASRAIFLPTISHAISNSMSQRAQSFSLKEKLKEVARQERTTVSNGPHVEPEAIQKAVSIRLWRLMQRRLHDPSAAKKLQSLPSGDVTLSTSEQDEDIHNILSFEHDSEPPVYSQSGDCLELDDEVYGEDLFDVEYESEWEDLFADREVAERPGEDDDMLDCLYDGLHDDNDESMFSGVFEDDLSSTLEDMLEL